MLLAFRDLVVRERRKVVDDGVLSNRSLDLDKLVLDRRLLLPAFSFFLFSLPKFPPHPLSFFLGDRCVSVPFVL